MLRARHTNAHGSGILNVCSQCLLRKRWVTQRPIRRLLINIRGKEARGETTQNFMRHYYSPTSEQTSGDHTHAQAKTVQPVHFPYQFFKLQTGIQNVVFRILVFRIRCGFLNLRKIFQHCVFEMVPSSAVKVLHCKQCEAKACHMIRIDCTKTCCLVRVRIPCRDLLANWFTHCLQKKACLVLPETHWLLFFCRVSFPPPTYRSIYIWNYLGHCLVQTITLLKRASLLSCGLHLGAVNSDTN